MFELSSLSYRYFSNRDMCKRILCVMSVVVIDVRRTFPLHASGSSELSLGIFKPNHFMLLFFFRSIVWTSPGSGSIIWMSIFCWCLLVPSSLKQLRLCRTFFYVHFLFWLIVYDKRFVFQVSIWLVKNNNLDDIENEWIYFRERTVFLGFFYSIQWKRIKKNSETNNSN